MIISITELFVLLRKVPMRVGDLSADDRVEPWNFVGGDDWLCICNARLVIRVEQAG